MSDENRCPDETVGHCNHHDDHAWVHDCTHTPGHVGPHECDCGHTWTTADD
ncbi:hypothetical protein [Mycolicibacterium thermoresistibile]|uniref:Uncharacterized protein n=1 Tax=Mycolicibacterium thermoresistibile (strain ATCC 19527 / DSM 44167 / CIP 105390 / JCM 6362 / NCTC 10409 / 316) TaxID=1078020 RepID=G7CF91_MYCT3|nr:hypothetical protein [Mycolicibacterium thermoresistibile]EHI13170.1 hypothetical protein KEK_08312 [Mycolicibacterium thermoresistibile ATCC 19527]MCV7187016.1 hypothetical protein [Mycolicibacterium thermoresistibile]SNW20362.1 Uncharacterised protein [Mycolicibacterium thermoresistibile]